MDEQILDDAHLSNRQIRRRLLLPNWIKVFVWIFMIFGVLIPIIFIIGIIGQSAEISLYGITTYQPLSLIGLFLLLLYIIKGLTAFGLWTEKEWAVKLALFDAILGIIVCTYVMLIHPFIFQENGFNLDFRLEIIVLILYFRKMREIQTEWEAD